MKILVLVDAIPADHVGGIAKAVDTELVELVSRGHEIRILTRRQRVRTPPTEVIDGVSITRFAAPLRGSPLYYLHPFITMIRAPGHIKRICRGWKPDIAYVHSAFLANALARAKVSTTKVFCYHAPAAEEIAIDASAKKYGPMSGAAGIAAKLVTRVERRALDGMDLTFTRSRFMHERLISWHPEFAGRNIEVCPIMVDTERYAFEECSQAARERLGLPADRPIIACARRLVNRMGLEDLIASVEMVRVRRPDLLCLIAGSGYLKPDLQASVDRRELSENVRLLGFVPEEDLPTLFAASTLCVVPSVALEGFGLASIEAMSVGRVVVATPVGGNLEVVGRFDEHLLTATATAPDLAARIEQWLDSAADIELRSKVRRHCEACYGRTVVGARIDKLLSGAVEAVLSKVGPPSVVEPLDELPGVSVIAPMHNEEASIDEFLACIASFDYPKEKLEVILVDGMSTDASAEKVLGYAAADSRIHLVTNPGRYAAAAMNVGIAAAKNDVIVRLDCHSLYAPNYLRNSVELLLRTPEAGVVGGLQRAHGTTAIQRVVAAAMACRFASGDAAYRRATAPQWADTVYLGTWRKETLVKVGGFDANWRINEDYELNIRLRKAGFRVLLSPNVQSTYRPRNTIGALAKQYYAYGFWRARTALAHPGFLRPRQAAPPLLVCLTLLALLAMPWTRLPLLIPALYLALLIGASVKPAGANLADTPRFAAVFATMHFAWGAGFLAGLLAWAPKRSQLSTTTGTLA
ncbi:MAG: glycosyltransferase [Fimbriimonadaceae bacterium]